MYSKKLRGILFISLILWATPCFAESVETVAKDVVIVVNENDPESLAIGRYYASTRGIPEKNIVRLSVSTEETITVQQYVETIANPLLNVLLENERIKGVKSKFQDRYGRDRLSVCVHQIPYLVLIRGIPLRIANDPELLEPNSSNLPTQFRVNHGSVDGEIALLLAASDTSMTAFVPNPYFQKSEISSIHSNRLLKVSRLDGPTKASVIHLIDRSIEAERTGLMGRAYIDLGGPHKTGDDWIRAAGELVEAAHFDTDYNTAKRRIDHRDRLDAPAIYMGWYHHSAYAQWRAPRWPVPPGAIGFHLHSFSATSVRDPKKWLGAFVAQGYCATMGNVYEPFLEYTHRPQTMLAHLLSGGRFGDAIMMSTPVLSWQAVAIGDPLFRPFKVSLEAQLENPGEHPFASYSSIREVNRLLVEEGREVAIAFARARFVNQPSLALAYSLAQLYEAAGDERASVEVLRIIRYMTVFSVDEYVLARKIASFLHKHGESELALKIFQNLLSERNLDRHLKISLYESGVPVAESMNEPLLAARWKQAARRLRNPPAQNSTTKKAQ
jgi:uncharacterized protein (TIGR03790 family)